jgi:hypothetical protein
MNMGWLRGAETVLAICMHIYIYVGIYYKANRFSERVLANTPTIMLRAVAGPSICTSEELANAPTVLTRKELRL